MYVNDGKYIHYPLILWVMFYPTIVPWPSTVFLIIYSRWFLHYTHWTESHVFFVQQFLFEKIEGETCLWHFFRWGSLDDLRQGRPQLSGVWSLCCVFLDCEHSHVLLDRTSEAFRRKNMGPNGDSSKETSPPKMGRLNLPPHPFRFVSVFFYLLALLRLLRETNG